MIEGEFFTCADGRVEDFGAVTRVRGDERTGVALNRKVIYIIVKLAEETDLHAPP